MSFVKICNYVKAVITFERDKSIISIEAFQNCYISSFNEGNLHSLLFITSAFGEAFRGHCVDPVFDRATRKLVIVRFQRFLAYGRKINDNLKQKPKRNKKIT